MRRRKEASDESSFISMSDIETVMERTAFAAPKTKYMV